MLRRTEPTPNKPLPPIKPQAGARHSGASSPVPPSAAPNAVAGGKPGAALQQQHQQQDAGLPTEKLPLPMLASFGVVSAVLLLLGFALATAERRAAAAALVQAASDRWFALLWTVLAPAVHGRTSGFKAELGLAGLAGNVLEIGPGLGANAPLLDPAAITHLTLVEPNRFMTARLNATLVARGFKPSQLTFVTKPLQDAAADAAQGSFDAVFGTLVLCSVPPSQLFVALETIYGWLRPGAPFVFLEHIASPHGSVARTVQEVVAPVFHTCGGGCNTRQDTETAIKALPWAVDIVGRQEGIQTVIWGRATKPSGLLAPGSLYKFIRRMF
ncbi:hypothetical protein HK105_205484 [Polyrhizophydium stewartii]|uniref:Uncharacterized protein n=1 Tax=Polyrhizophydium stewartii TaxID=2732419 RepID=A0ABR4N652_9FUNG